MTEIIEFMVGVFIISLGVLTVTLSLSWRNLSQKLFFGAIIGFVVGLCSSVVIMERTVGMGNKQVILYLLVVFLSFVYRDVLISMIED